MNRIQKILLIGGNVSDFGEGMLGPLFAILTQKVGGDILEISWASALYLFIVGSLTVLFGKLSDTWNKAWVMLAGYFLSAVFTFGYVFVSTPTHLFIIQAGLGLATALALPTWNALYSENAHAKKHGTSWGLASGLHHIIGAISILTGGFILSKLSFNVLFIIMGSVQTIATLYQAKILWTKSST